MTVPPDFPEVPPTAVEGGIERRSGVGWVLLAIILSLMTALTLVVYFSPRAPEGSQRYSQQEALLRHAVRAERLGQMVPALNTPHKRLLDDPVSILAGLRKNDPHAAALYVVMRHEQGEALKEKDLAILRGSKVPEHQALARVYAPGKVTDAQMRAAAAGLPRRKRFLYDLARVHALERAKVPRAREGLVSGFEAMAPILLSCGGCLMLLFSAGAWIMVALGVLRGMYARWIPLSAGGADAFALRGAQALLVFIGLQFVSIPFAHLGVRGALESALTSVIIFAGLALLYGRVPVLGRLVTLLSVGFTNARLGRNIVLGVAAGIANFPVAALLGVLGSWLFRFLPEPQHPATQELMAKRDPMTVLSLLVAAAVLAPLIEETIFRGTLFPALTSKLGSPVWGAFLSSLAFAAMHPQGIPLWLSLGAVGMMGCFLTHRTGSLVPAIAMHAAHNGITLTLGLTIT